MCVKTHMFYACCTFSCIWFAGSRTGTCDLPIISSRHHHLGLIDLTKHISKRTTQTLKCVAIHVCMICISPPQCIAHWHADVLSPQCKVFSRLPSPTQTVTSTSDEAWKSLGQVELFPFLNHSLWLWNQWEFCWNKNRIHNQCCRNTLEFCQTSVWQNSRFCQTEQNFVGPNFL